MKLTIHVSLFRLCIEPFRAIRLGTKGQIILGAWVAMAEMLLQRNP